MNATHQLAMDRWQTGHHLFFTLIQSLIVIMERFHEQLDANDMQAAAIELRRANRVLWGVSVTFKLTGDFKADAYEHYIRVVMSEVSEDFSGMWAHDHDYLVKRVLRKLKPIFKNPPAELAVPIAEFREVFAIMYDSHKYVCGRFEGNAPSMLMGEETQKSAVGMIDTFKHNRLLMLGEKK